MGKGHPRACPKPQTTLTLSPPYIPHPIDEPLVELLHGSLELATLELPLLVIPDRLQRWSLPSRRSGEVVNVINPPHVVNSALPALGKKRQATVINSWQFKGSEVLGDQCGRREQKAWAHQLFFSLHPLLKLCKS